MKIEHVAIYFNDLESAKNFFVKFFPLSVHLNLVLDLLFHHK